MLEMDVSSQLFIDGWIKPLFGVSDSASLVSCMIFIKLVYTVLTFLWMLVMPAPYGRYASSKFGAVLNARLAWCLQEIPALLVPLLLVLFAKKENFFCESIANRILIGMYMLHYFQRSLIYPFLIRGGKPTPLAPFLAAVVFCLFNGFMQGFYFVNFRKYDDSWIFDVRFIFGSILFISGMIINIHSDYVLRNLRKPGETSYKIPRGGLFDFVTGANYLGEIVEWIGFAVASCSPTAAVFALFTALFLGLRSYHHHRYYLEKFDDYPQDRKVIIPFIW